MSTVGTIFLVLFALAILAGLGLFIAARRAVKKVDERISAREAVQKLNEATQVRRDYDAPTYRSEFTYGPASQAQRNQQTAGRPLRSNSKPAPKSHKTQESSSDYATGGLIESEPYSGFWGASDYSSNDSSCDTSSGSSYSGSSDSGSSYSSDSGSSNSSDSGSSSSSCD